MKDSLQTHAHPMADTVEPKKAHDRRSPLSVVVSHGFVAGLATSLLILFLAWMTWLEVGQTTLRNFLVPEIEQSSSRVDNESDPMADQLAPDFTLKTLDGSEITLSDLRGQPVLINFWASWCSPCRLEMPELIRSYEQYTANGFTILAVNLDPSGCTARCGSLCGGV